MKKAKEEEEKQKEVLDKEGRTMKNTKNKKKQAKAK